MNLKKYKLASSRFEQLFFTTKEAFKLAFQIKPRFLISIILLSAFWGFLAFPGFYVEKLIIDTAISSIGTDDVKSVLITIFWFVALRAVIELLQSILSNSIGFLKRNLSKVTDVHIHLLIAKKLAELDVETLENPQFKDKYTKIESESGMRAWAMILPLVDIPNYLVGFISGVFVLVFVHPIIAVMVILVSIPRFIVDSKYVKLEYSVKTELSPTRKVVNWLNHYLIWNRSFLELKLLDLSGTFSERLKKAWDEILGKEFQVAKKRETAEFLTLFPFSLLEVLVSVSLIFRVLVETLTIGTFELYIRSLRSAHSNFVGLMNSFSQMYENYVYINDLVWFLSLKSSIESQDTDTLDVPIISTISLKNVQFRYKKRASKIINGIDLDIKMGEKIALVGENGSGKSTFIKLLAKFYNPTSGQILISGVDLHDIQTKSWRSKLAILFQEFEVYAFSARESIGLGDVARMENLEEIKDAARKTGIDKFIEGIPKKYDNPIAPEFKYGVRPSIGQLQRFGISRMIFRKNAEVIILDEPTSSIDPEAEESIFREIKAITDNKILIFVTQRFSTVKIADRILVMDKGKIIEDGTHNDLMKKNGKYARLFNLQAKAYLQSKDDKP